MMQICFLVPTYRFAKYGLQLVNRFIFKNKIVEEICIVFCISYHFFVNIFGGVSFFLLFCTNKWSPKKVSEKISNHNS